MSNGYSEFHKGAQGGGEPYQDYTGPTGKLTPKSYGETPHKEPKGPTKLGGKKNG